MGNILFILWRDIKRLLRTPAAMVVVVGLIFIPCMYAWFNVAGFWDPYQNTRNIKVAVANEDRGADSAVMGKLDLGTQLVDKLKDNDQLGWTFLDRAGAMDCVKSGSCYSAVIIPADFSKDMANVVTGDGERPTLEYYVNEELTPVGAKISDTGASTLDRQVNSTFVSTVSSVVADAVNKTNEQISADSDSAVDQVGTQLSKTEANIARTRSMIADLKGTLAQSSTKTDAARTALDAAQSAAGSAGSGLTQAGSLLTQSRTQLNTFLDDTGSQFDQGASLFSRASGQAAANASNVANGLITASGGASEALNELTSVNESTAQMLDQLKALNADGIDSSTLATALASLEQANQQASAALASATALNDATAKAADSALDTVTQFGSTSQTTLGAINDARSKISTGALPQLDDALGSLAATSGTLGAAVSGQAQLAAQTKLVLDQVDQVSKDTSATLDSTDDLLATFADKLKDVDTDVKTLASTNILEQFTGEDGKLDAERIATFMLSPTVLTTHTLYPIATYGSGMAPLFTSMALWVGVFMLMCLMRLEVDDDGLEGRMVTPGQKYVARFLLLAIVATCQAIAATVGDLIIGVQTVNRFMFILTAILASWSYLSIGYALSTMFMHVGKGLVVALVIVQIPGASGLYPIEMMPKFFRVLYPFFPFTYTITAFRETIGGFYDGTWIKMALMLAVFAAISFFCGLVLRPLMANLNALFAREVGETDMIAAEPVTSVPRRANLSQILHVLADKGGYRQQIEARAQRFARLYPRLMRGAFIAGILVPAILAVTFSLTDGTKLVALATWIVWILAIILFLMVVEYIRDSLRRQAQLGTLTDESLRAMLLDTSPVLQSVARRRAAARHGEAASWAQAASAARAAAPVQAASATASTAGKAAPAAASPVEAAAMAAVAPPVQAASTAAATSPVQAVTEEAAPVPAGAAVRSATAGQAPSAASAATARQTPSATSAAATGQPTAAAPIQGNTLPAPPAPSASWEHGWSASADSAPTLSLPPLPPLPPLGGQSASASSASGPSNRMETGSPVSTYSASGPSNQAETGSPASANSTSGPSTPAITGQSASTDSATGTLTPLVTGQSASMTSTASPSAGSGRPAQAGQAGAAATLGDTAASEDADAPTGTEERLRRLQETLALDLRGIRGRLPHAHRGRHGDADRGEGHRWPWDRRRHGGHDDGADDATAATNPTNPTPEGGDQA